MRRWAFLTLGDEQALQFVAMATPEDLNANAEFIRQANEYIEVPGGKNVNNYANVKLIVDIAKRQGVDAVWPGWGHASENPRLPAALKAAGITFIGPTSPVMAVLGDKIGANILAQTAKVPSIPWSGDGLTAELNEEGTIPQETFNKACITNVEEAIAAAKRIGYPVMIKASEGGGGKGIRRSEDESTLAANYEQVKAEVAGSPIFMMQLCSNARHLEVQIVGDEHGNAIALSGRDCSTQRRFQKIFEEGPPIIADPEVFREMELAAMRLTQSIGYVGAGTVEYLYNAASKKFFFLELNPRLQVEHPVTEGITDVNVPATQLQVAMGIPLDRIPDIRRFYNVDPEGSSRIDFFNSRYTLPKRHVIAARITAENPDEGFKPTSGTIERVFFQSTPSVWGYFSVGANGGIHEFADSQFGHLFATGPTREDARKALLLALKGLVVRGEIRTATEYLGQLLQTEAFIDNTIDTAWLDGIIKAKSISVGQPPKLVVTAAAVVRAVAHCRTEEAAFLASLGKGQSSIAGLDNINTFATDITYQDVKYSFKCSRVAPDTFRFRIGGDSTEVRVREQSDGTLLALWGGVTHQLLGFEEPLGLRLALDGSTMLLPTQFDPSELRTDVTGKVVRFLQSDGGEVEKGKPYAEVEAMKMVMPLLASESGRVKHAVSAGSIIDAGDLLASLELRDPGKAKKIAPFAGSFDFGVPADDSQGPTSSVASSPSERFAHAQEQMALLMAGFDLGDVEPVVQSLLSSVCDPGLGGTQLGAERYKAALSTISGVINSFLAVEDEFVGRALDDTVLRLVKANSGSLAKVAALAQAHRALPRRSAALLSLLRQLRTLPQRAQSGPISWEDDLASLSEDISASLKGLARLYGPSYGEVALLASHLLAEKRLPPISDRMRQLRDLLVGKVALERTWEPAGSPLAAPGDLQAIVESPTLAVDLLPSLLDDADVAVRRAAAEVYVRRMYRAHNMLSLDIDTAPATGKLLVRFAFQFKDTPARESPVRYGTLALLSTVAEAGSSMPGLMAQLRAQIQSAKPANVEFKDWVDPVNVLHVACNGAVGSASGAEMAAALDGHQQALTDLGVKFVNLVAFTPLQLPRYHTYTAQLGYKEDPLYRGERPTFAHLLELSRLTNYDMQRIPTVNRDLHIYVGTGNDPKTPKKAQPNHLFLRRISHSKDVAAGGLERILAKALDSLELAVLDPKAAATMSSRLFVNFLPALDEGGMAAAVASYSERISQFIGQNATRLLALRVDEIEIKLRILDEEHPGEAAPIRVLASSLSGQWLKVDMYKDVLDPVTGGARQFCLLRLASNEDGSPLAEVEQCFLEPYPTMDKVQRKRAAARRTASTYCYDFLGLLEKSLVAQWQSHLDSLPDDSGASVPQTLFSSHELVLQNGELVKEQRPVGLNTVGMVAWHTIMRTPQYPVGRDVVIIANDTTIQSGSFGVPEDDFFFKASEYARERGIPRIYIACNSGARIGLVEELKPILRVAWVDEANPALGFKHLYVLAADLEALPEGTAIAREEVVNGERRLVLSDIVGLSGPPIGVENLRGSGLIAGETSRAYAETFTLSYVTGRSVGIGAYLCRLGQRIIQMRQGPLILTGYGALNKLLGREVYSSQDQLGGPQVMAPNGISHQVVENDREGVAAILAWLSYVPKDVHSQVPRTPTADPWDRLVKWTPTPTPYDPRLMLTGAADAHGEWMGGFFDKGSFSETMAGWGKTVVAGRARLGGIPMGVIAVETRLQELRIPADPANPDSRETILPQAGQVWFPDSAYKTAQAIQDFGHAENLPLMIFANWRGFSGGTRDMFDEILKFGAMIVDALREYKQPVFVYIPPRGELRGGAWVVVDPTINEQYMEMYADKEARGGILEPPGICEVKFRKQDQLKLMHRLDSQLAALLTDPVANAGAIAAREELLLPIYTQIAHEFADLHDRAGRMKAKGVIRDVVSWENSRAYFYWRLRRRLAEDGVRREFSAVAPELTQEAVSDVLRKAMGAKLGAGATWDDDQSVALWLEGDRPNLQQRVAAEGRAAKVAGITRQLADLDPAARREVLEAASKAAR